MIENIGIIGEGKMGSNILYYLIDMDFKLTWICSSFADLDKLHRNFNKRMTRTLEAGIIDDDRYQSIMDRLVITSDISALSSCDLIIDAIFEDLEQKQKLFKDLDEIVQTSCIFTTNSSSIIPSKLVPSQTRKDKFAGLHFFYPVALKDIVEIIGTPEVSKETVFELSSFLEKIRRQFLILEEKDSFILNRIFLDFQNEAFLIVHEKIASLQQIDQIVKEHFFPFGVFEFFDSVGLDIMLASVKNYIEDDPEETRSRFYPLIAQLQEHVSNGRLGKKSCSGFYNEESSIDSKYPENSNEIISRLKTSYEQAFRRFCISSSIPASALKAAMDEYFGVETPVIL